MSKGGCPHCGVHWGYSHARECKEAVNPFMDLATTLTLMQTQIEMLQKEHKKHKKRMDALVHEVTTHGKRIEM